MKKNLPFLLLILCFLSCGSKQEPIDSVYDYISYVLKTSSVKTGPVKIEEFRLSRKHVSKWVAVIEKSGDSCIVKFYSSKAIWLENGEKPEERDYPLVLDTSYTSSIKEVATAMLTEEELDLTRPSFDHVNNLILISRNSDNRRFTSRDIGGLKHIFRYNKFYDESQR